MNKPEWFEVTVGEHTVPDDWHKAVAASAMDLKIKRLAFIKDSQSIDGPLFNGFNHLWNAFANRFDSPSPRRSQAMQHLDGIATGTGSVRKNSPALNQNRSCRRDHDIIDPIPF